MSFKDSDRNSERSYNSHDSEYNYITNYVFEEEGEPAIAAGHNDSDSNNDGVYENEPMADEEWIENYKRIQSKLKEKQENQKRRYALLEQVTSWQV